MTATTWSAGGTAHVDGAVSALAAGDVVVVAGGWGSGRTTLLRDVAAGCRPPGLLVVDDAHLAPRVQLDELAEALTAGRSVAVAVGRQARLDRTVRRALASRRTAQVDLVPLGVAEVGSFLDAHVPDGADPGPADVVLRATGGVLALLDAVVRDGSAPDVPGPRVRERVEALLDGLGTSGRAAVTTLMCTGALPVVIADRVLSEGAVDDLQAAGLVVEGGAEDSPDLRLAADLLTTGWEGWVTPRRRRALLGRVVGGTTAADVDGLTLRQRVSVARWTLDGSPDDLALVRCGVRPAVLTGALDVAATFAGHVLRHDPADEETRQTLVIALEAAGDHAAAARWGTGEGSDAVSLAAGRPTSTSPPATQRWPGPSTPPTSQPSRPPSSQARRPPTSPGCRCSPVTSTTAAPPRRRSWPTPRPPSRRGSGRASRTRPRPWWPGGSMPGPCSTSPTGWSPPTAAACRPTPRSRWCGPGRWCSRAAVGRARSRPWPRGPSPPAPTPCRAPRGTGWPGSRPESSGRPSWPGPTSTRSPTSWSVTPSGWAAGRRASGPWCTH